MTHTNSHLSQVGSAPAISRTVAKKSVEYSPELQQQADELTEKLLERLRESIKAATLFALSQQKSESTATIWLERRIFRPAQQLIERTTQAKKPSLPPPSTRETDSKSESTGTWRKAQASSAASRVSVPPPSSRRQEEEASAVLQRVLARPDRASIPPKKHPTPPPPLSQPRTALGSESSAAEGSAPEPSTTEDPAAGGSASRGLIPRLEQKLAALRYLDSPKEQAAFLLDLIDEVAPLRTILLHTIDPKSQQSTVVGEKSPQAPAFAGLCTPPEDPLLTQVRRLHRAVKILSPSGDERIGAGRWALCPPERYLIALPVLKEHKLLGLVELADPVNASRLTQEQLDAILELARAWGARLSQS